MYVYYKGDDVYMVMLLLVLTLQPSHVGVDSESLSLSVTVIKFSGLRLFHDFVPVSTRIGFNHGVLCKYFPLGLRISFGIIVLHSIPTGKYIWVTGIPVGMGRNE